VQRVALRHRGAVGRSDTGAAERPSPIECTLEAISEDRGAAITTSTIEILRNRAELLQNGSEPGRARRGRNPAVL
jgi:hypothetical protein